MEPGTNAEIKEQARECFDAEFPLLAKDDVNGPNATPLFRYLRHQSRLYDQNKQQTRQVPWNFTKFLVNRQTEKVEYFNPRVSQKDVIKAIKKITNSGPPAF